MAEEPERPDLDDVIDPAVAAPEDRREHGKFPDRHEDDYFEHRDEHEEHPNQGSTGRPGEHLEHLVDDMEKRVEEERDERGVEGSATDRHRRAPIDTGDEAPD